MYSPCPPSRYSPRQVTYHPPGGSDSVRSGSQWLIMAHRPWEVMVHRLPAICTWDAATSARRWIWLTHHSMPHSGMLPSPSSNWCPTSFFLLGPGAGVPCEARLEVGFPSLLPYLSPLTAALSSSRPVVIAAISMSTAAADPTEMASPTLPQPMMTEEGSQFC